MPNESYPFNPSDSGLLDGAAIPPHVGGAPRMDDPQEGKLPDPPAPAPVDYDDPEESLRNVPLPTGFMSRLRQMVDRL